jgi:4'-phosphopantetheinyl transferase EntD
LAHTQGWAAAIWSRHSRVGIDIEELNRPINTEVARMFMNANELELYSWNIDTEYYLKNWCAKEVIYKIFQPCQIPVISFKNDIGIVPTTDPDVSTYKLNRPTEPTACGFVQYRKHSDLLIAYAVH